MTAGGRARVWPALGIVAAGMLGFLLLRVVGGGMGPALYDGACLPLPYHSLGANPGPGSATATFTADQLNQTQEVATNESNASSSGNTPQAQIIIAAGSFAPPAGASVTVTITPVPHPSVQPAGGSIAGNAYQFAARSSSGQPVDLVPGHPATVVLTAPPSAGPQLTLERFTGSSWSALKTYTSGCGDTEEASTQSLGIFALVAAGSSAPPATSSGPSLALIVVAVVIVLLAAAVVTARVRRGRGRRPGGQVRPVPPRRR